MEHSTTSQSINFSKDAASSASSYLTKYSSETHIFKAGGDDRTAEISAVDHSRKE